MLEEGRGCLDIAQQLQAVEKVVANAKKALVHGHINYCLEQETVLTFIVTADQFRTACTVFRGSHSP